MQSAQNATNALEAVVKQADVELSERPPAIPEESTLDSGALQSAASVRREAAIRAVSAAIAAGDIEQARTAASAYRQWVGDAAGVVERGLRTERLLRDGYLPGERGSDGASVDELLAGLESAPAGSAALAVQPLVRRVDSVRRIAAMDDVAAVIAAADRSALEASGRGATEVLAAWARLASLGWPGTIESLGKATELRIGPVAAAVASIPDAARRKAVEDVVAADAERMWLTFSSAAGGTEEGIAALQRERSRMGVPETALQRLPGRVRYNIARLALQREVEQAFTKPERERDDAARAAASNFLLTVRAISPDMTAAPAAAGLVSVAADAQSDAGRADLSGLGPAKLGWAAEVAEDGALVTYRRAGGPALTFRRAPQPETGAAEMVTFVSVGEVSIALFNAMAADAGVAEAIRPLMVDFSLGLTDPRSGVRAWDWSRRPGELLTPARADAASNGWLRRRPQMDGRSYYPAGMQVASPSDADPVTWISPVAAAYLARAAGCRLPTEAEWRRSAQASDPSGANRRDASWGRVFGHVQASLVAQQPDWPGAGVFWPEGAERVPSHQDNALAVEGDDGSPWFAGASGQQGAFRHLIGNAAEFVIVAAEPPAVATATPAAIEAALAAAGVAVVGGSAISPPAVDPMTAYPVSLARASNGFADVGFRLAFTAPRGLGGGSYAQRLRTAMEGAGLMDVR